MAVKANGATLEWAGYEYARMSADGELIDIGEFDDIMSRLHITEKVFFRALYVTDWMETTDEPA
jgi:hypothetical protein